MQKLYYWKYTTFLSPLQQWLFKFSILSTHNRINVDTDGMITRKIWFCSCLGPFLSNPILQNPLSLYRHAIGFSSSHIFFSHHFKVVIWNRFHRHPHAGVLDVFFYLIAKVVYDMNVLNCALIWLDGKPMSRLHRGSLGSRQTAIYVMRNRWRKNKHISIPCWEASV